TRFWRAGVFACALAAAEVPPEPTFYRDVLPILSERCQTCHRAGEASPMALESYRQVRPWAAAIRDAVVSRKMPPWFADPRFGQFTDDPSLKPEQIRTIVEWVRSGARAGDPADAPPKTSWPQGWNIGAPDLVLRPAVAFDVPANGAVEYQHIILP